MSADYRSLEDSPSNSQQRASYSFGAGPQKSAGPQRIDLPSFGLQEITVDMQLNQSKSLTGLSSNQINKAKQKRHVKRKIRKTGLPQDEMANIVAGYLHSKRSENGYYEYLTNELDYGNEMAEGQRLECSDAELKAAMGQNATSLGGEKRGRSSPLR